MQKIISIVMFLTLMIAPVLASDLPIWGEAKAIVKDLLTDNVKIQSTLANYSRIYRRFYAGEFHNVTQTLKDYPLANGGFYEAYSTRVSKTAKGGKTSVWSNSQKITIGFGVDELNQQSTNLTPEFAPLEIRSYNCDVTSMGEVRHNTSFGYRLTWVYDVSPNKAWPMERDFNLTLSDWINQRKDCVESYKDNGVVYSTKKPIYEGSWQGEVIECSSMDTISGLVNLESKREGSQLRFSNKFKQVYPNKP